MKAKTSHWTANRARLFRADGTRLCDVKLSYSRDDGTIHIGDKMVLQARNERGDRSWCLLQDRRELLYAFLMPGDVPCVIVEKKGEETGVITERMRIRREATGFVYHVHKFATEMNAPVQTTTTKIEEKFEGHASETTGTVSEQVTTIVQTTSVDGLDVEVRPETNNGGGDDDEEFELGDCPSGKVIESSDFPTPVSYLQPRKEEAKLCAVFTAYHPRKYRVEVMEKIDDVMLSFLFFFFRVIERNEPAQIPKSNSNAGVILAKELQK